MNFGHVIISHASALSRSSTHLLTALRDSQSIQHRLHRSSFSFLLPPISSFPSPASDTTPAAVRSLIPQSFQRFMTVPQHDQISSHVTSKRIYQSLGSGMLLSRVVRSIEAHARVCGGCITYNGVRSLWCQLLQYMPIYCHESERPTCRLGLTSISGLHHPQRQGLGF